MVTFFSNSRELESVRPMAACSFFRPSQPACRPTYEVSGVGDPNGVGKRPKTVPGVPKDFLRAYTAPDGSTDPKQSGLEARKLIAQELPQCGVLLLQGLPITTPEQCSAFVDALSYRREEYEPFGKRRAKVHGEVDAATNIPGANCLAVHNEMSYNPRLVGKILLMCLQPAEQGGENLVARNSDVMSNLPADLRDTFAKKGGIRYQRIYPNAKRIKPGTFAMSWQDRTGTEDPEAAKQFWRDAGFSDIVMDDDETLLVTNTEAAVKTAPDGSPTWINNAALPAFMPGSLQMFRVTYGDGDEIPVDICSKVDEAQWNSTYAVPLAAGSALILDNWSVMHGRLPYSGGSRSMAALLTND